MFKNFGQYNTLLYMVQTLLLTVERKVNLVLACMVLW